MDRLPDWGYTEQELNTMAEDIINPPRYCTDSKCICWYHLMKDGEWTGKSMVLAVESVVDGIDAVNRMVNQYGLSVVPGEYGKESVLNNWKIDAIHMVLDRYKYVGKIKFAGSDKIYSYEDWMIKLI